MEDRKQALEQDEKMAKQWVEDTKKFHQKAEESYYDVMNELPSGWKKIAIQVCLSAYYNLYQELVLIFQRKK